MEKPSNNELIFSRTVLERAAYFDTSYIQDGESLKRYVVPLAAPLSVILRNFGESLLSELPPYNLFSPEDPESDFGVVRRIGNGVILLTENEDSFMISKWHNSDDFDSNILTIHEPDIFISVPKTEENDAFACKINNEIIMPLYFPDDRDMSLRYVDTLQIVLKDIVSTTK